MFREPTIYNSSPEKTATNWAHARWKIPRVMNAREMGENLNEGLRIDSRMPLGRT